MGRHDTAIPESQDINLLETDLFAHATNTEEKK
jgi:hypothetical protein